MDSAPSDRDSNQRGAFRVSHQWPRQLVTVGMLASAAIRRDGAEMIKAGARVCD